MDKQKNNLNSMSEVDKQSLNRDQNMSNEEDQLESQSSDSNSSNQSPIQSLSDDSDSEQLSEESSPIEAAIKTMKFRKKRGSKMNDLMNGKIDNDVFWEKNCVYFGGNLKDKELEEDSEDYQQSSSGRDQFDSDFNLTDSYPGKRGRKKGSKVKKSRGRGRGRGRPRKHISSDSQGESDEQEHCEKKKEKRKQRSRSREKKINKSTRKFRKVVGNPDDQFIIFKAEPLKQPLKRGRKKKVIEEEKEECKDGAS